MKTLIWGLETTVHSLLTELKCVTVSFLFERLVSASEVTPSIDNSHEYKLRLVRYL